MPVIRTLAGAVQVEIPRIKGSRFVADAAPVQDEAEGLAFLGQVQARWPDASHHCWAWRLDAERTRSSDDGEPGGTAGEPILKRLVGADLEGVMVVVSRWFGGTKLGMGGLVRAYGEATTVVLAEAEVTETRVCGRLVVTLDYGLTGAVQSVLTAHGLEPVDEAYGAQVTLTLRVPVEDLGVVRDDLTERTAGRVTMHDAEDP